MRLLLGMLAGLAVASPAWGSRGFEFRDPDNNASILGTLNTSGGLTASSGTFTATGNTQYSLATSSGIWVKAGGVKWADGSVSTTAAVQGGGTVGASVSSATYITPGSLNAVLNLEICYATVTFTLPSTMSGQFWHSGTIYNNAGGNGCKIAYLIDGVLPSRFSKTVGLTSVLGANETNGTAYDDLPELGAGVHTVCILFAAQTGGGGVCTWPSNQVTVQSQNRFGVRFWP
jgi:hypothetical protein